MVVLKSETVSHWMRATGDGAWGELEHVQEATKVRLKWMRYLDGHARVYFDARRDQVVTGPRFAMMRSPYGMGPGYCYRVTTQLEFIRRIPKGLVGIVVPTDMMTQLGLSVISSPLYPLFLIDYQTANVMTTDIPMTMELVLPEDAETGLEDPEPESEPEPEPESESEAETETVEQELKPEAEPEPEVKEEPKPEPKAEKPTTTKKKTTTGGSGKKKTTTAKTGVKDGAKAKAKATAKA
jgi:hypothetical protein